MRELHEAIEIGCRAIEQAMANKGQRMSFHMREANTRSDPHAPPTDFQGKLHGFAPGKMRFEVCLDGVYLGDISQEKQAQRDELRVALNIEGKAAVPSVVADIPDAGYRAGVKALLQKFQTAIQNATEIAEGGQPTGEYIRMLDKSGSIRPDDIAVKLVQKVLDLRDEMRAAEESAERARRELEDSPEKQLHARLKLKMKANYTDQREVLMEFQNYILDHYSAHFPDARPNAVDEFLENVGDE